MTPEEILKAPHAQPQPQRTMEQVRADMYWHQAMFAAQSHQIRAMWLARAAKEREGAAQ